MKVSAKGRKLIKREEGERLTAYQETRGIWTIGCGHTSAAGEPTVRKGLKITAAQSEEILERDLGATERAIAKAVKVPLSQNQFDTLASLIHNIGEPSFKKSTLLKKLNAKDYQGAADQFLVWKKAGKDTSILLARRKREREIFLTPDTAGSAKPVAKSGYTDKAHELREENEQLRKSVKEQKHGADSESSNGED